MQKKIDSIIEYIQDFENEYGEDLLTHFKIVDDYAQQFMLWALKNGYTDTEKFNHYNYFVTESDPYAFNVLCLLTNYYTEPDFPALINMYVEDYETKELVYNEEPIDLWEKSYKILAEFIAQSDTLYAEFLKFKEVWSVHHEY